MIGTPKKHLVSCALGCVAPMLMDGGHAGAKVFCQSK